jgi:GxxExxY protein
MKGTEYFHHRGRRGRRVGIDGITRRVIGAAIAVHRELGPGLLESAYEACVAAELAQRGVAFRRQAPLAFTYRGTPVDAGYRLDFVVEELVIVELKSVARLEPIHAAQVLTYLKLARLPVGLLINFNVPFLRHGIRRLVAPGIDPSVLSAPSVVD